MKNTNGNLKITKLGKIIRKLKIDELPQLFNVLKDDMSLIDLGHYILILILTIKVPT